MLQFFIKQYMRQVPQCSLRPMDVLARPGAAGPMTMALMAQASFGGHLCPLPVRPLSRGRGLSCGIYLGDCNAVISKTSALGAYSCTSAGIVSLPPTGTADDDPRLTASFHRAASGQRAVGRHSVPYATSSTNAGSTSASISCQTA